MGSEPGHGKGLAAEAKNRRGKLGVAVQRPGVPGGAEEALWPWRNSCFLPGRVLGAAVGEVERRDHPNSSQDLKEDTPFSNQLTPTSRT